MFILIRQMLFAIAHGIGQIQRGQSHHIPQRESARVHQSGQHQGEGHSASI